MRGKPQPGESHADTAARKVYAESARLIDLRPVVGILAKCPSLVSIYQIAVEFDDPVDADAVELCSQSKKNIAALKREAGAAVMKDIDAMHLMTWADVDAVTRQGLPLSKRLGTQPAQIFKGLYNGAYVDRETHELDLEKLPRVGLKKNTSPNGITTFVAYEKK